MSGLTASNLLVVCGAWGRSSAQRMSGEEQYSMDSDMLQLQVGGRRDTSSLQLSRFQVCQGRGCERESRRERQRLQRECCSTPATTSQDNPSLRCCAATHSNSSSLSRSQLHRPVPPQWEKRLPPSLKAQTNKYQASQFRPFRLLMQAVRL
jgi:hypothetical protein